MGNWEHFCGVNIPHFVQKEGGGKRKKGKKLAALFFNSSLDGEDERKGRGCQGWRGRQV